MIIFLLIINIWFILYFIRLRRIIYGNQNYLGRVNAEQMQTHRILRALGKKCGYDLLNCDNWIKEDKNG